MSSFPGSPRVLRGGIVVVDPSRGGPNLIIPLQYNPDTLTRTLQVKGVGQESGDRLESLRLKGPPVETIKVEAEIDATDQLEAGDPLAISVGLHPVLATLELLIYPASATLQSNEDAASRGTLEIIAAEAPLTVFVFGPNRIVPVRITEYSVTEEAFDINLNPLRAKLNLTLRVLNTDDVSPDAKSYPLFMAYLRAKETTAQQFVGVDFKTLGITGLPF